jgi:hypothetical protein
MILETSQLMQNGFIPIDFIFIVVLLSSLWADDAINNDSIKFPLDRLISNRIQEIEGD